MAQQPEHPGTRADCLVTDRNSHGGPRAQAEMDIGVGAPCCLPQWHLKIHHDYSWLDKVSQKLFVKANLAMFSYSLTVSG